ncbi:MAG: CHAT domain-containing protein [Bacteroidales bacterium]|nr:CHAT domain-containing protein [Bacteroidales bacterium]
MAANLLLAEPKQDLPADSVQQKILADSAQSYTYTGLDYYDAGNFDMAEKYLNKSLDIYESIYEKGHRKIGITYINLGAVFLRHWRYGEAMHFFDKAEEHLRLNPEKYARELGGTLVNKGIVYSSLGDYTRAKMTEEMALKIMLTFDDSETRKRTINLYNILANINKDLKEYREGIEHFMQAEKLALEYNPDFLHLIYGNLGNIYLHTGNFQKGEYYYKKAISAYHEQHISQPLALALIYNNYAELCLNNQFFEKSFRLNKEALRHAMKNKYEKNPTTSNIYNLFGQYYEAKAAYDSALHYYQRAVCSLFNDFNDLSVYANPGTSGTISKIHLLKCLKSKAGAFKKYFQHSRDMPDMQASVETYDLALKLIDEIRSGYQDEKSKLYLNENERITYDEAIDAAYEMFETTGDDRYKHLVFDYSEKSKASVLLSALRDVGAKNFGGIPGSMLKQESDLVRDIAFYSEQIYEERKRDRPDSLKIDLWERKLFSIKESYDDLISAFENNYPEYYALKYQKGMVTIGEIQNRIQRKTSVLEYALTGSMLYTFLISKNGFDISAQPLDSVFYGTYDSMLESIGYVDPTRHDEKKFNQFVFSALSMYKYLVEPLAANIESKRLIIIPDGALSMIPFEALITDAGQIPGGHPDYKDLPLLLKEYAVSYAHSSTTLFLHQTVAGEKSSGGLLAFAPSYDGEDINTLRGLPRNNYRKNLTPIPGAREEVKQITRLFRGKVLVDEDATELAFKEYAGDYNILHLAMHTVIDNQNPMYSKLVFTATTDSTEDNMLNTHEIYNLSLRARMVVLSSCSSGEGLLKRGEGVISLARGFSYAGCPSLVMTLWEVEDRVSVDLIVEFYKYLKKGFQKDVALQKAKLDFLSDQPQLLSHPFYWSPYQCIGDTSPLRSPLKRYFYIVLFAGLAVILFAFFMKHRRHGKE